MAENSAWQRITRGQDLKWILRTHGFRGTIRWVRRSFPYYMWLHTTPAGRRERDFDSIHGVETDGMVPRWEMHGAGPNLQYAVQYLPTKPSKFRKLIASLRINYQDFTFLDIGSGKGRVLLLASEYPFQKIVEVEFVPGLCEIGRRNLSLSKCSAEIICIDATAYELPLDPLVIYMCNPFEVELISKFVKNIEHSYRVSPRSITVLYYNALHVQPFLDCGVLHLVSFRRDDYAVFSTGGPTKTH